MAGQGITVSIQAKIEGWQDQIKQIQNAMKNIKPGTDISKGLVKDLQQVNDMVNNLGKNMNQRLTSDSQITGFVDKIMQVEEVFGRLGTSMSHISFGDINPEYITAGFKDLLSTLEQANNALGQGMESSFQNAIANSKTLQKEFERMKIDPKTMNIDAVREALAERGKSLEKDVNDGLKKLTDFEKGLEKLKIARDELTARDKFLGKDANATAQSLLIGHQLPTKGTILDADELDKQISFFRSNLLKAGFTPTQLGRIIPDLESVMKAGHWDEMPSKFAEYLREAQNRTRNSLEKASQDYGAAVLQHQKMVGAQNHLSSLRFNNTQAQNDVTRILSDTVPKDTKSLRDVVNNIKQQLETAVTSGFKGLGSTLFGSSQQGMQDASAAMKDYSAALDQVKAKEQAVNKVQGVVQRYFSIYAAVRMVSKGIRSMMNNIKELDKTITEIAIVTKMDQNQLWGQMPQYTKLAKNYAASISGVYKVSQLYYQQGLGQQDVMALTEQTLKMARISGLDYAEATDYMTNAVRSFKMEMTDAATVVDVYSAVAASSASSVTELATAMSKTASSAAAVGSSFENTTAMLAVMIEATRESPENIGSAMKSIISRYGELKENKTGIDEEGEEYSLNKVDKALQTVGISIHDANGEFRDFDDVIFELAEKWNTIDKNTQRYIATVMAGNRQQSRFLALVSSTERLKEESEKAANSEDASQLQFLKTMDSIEAKTQQFQTSLQSLYTSSGLEKLYKGLLDFGNEFANTLENISGKSGLVGAVSNVGASFLNMATFATTGFSLVKSKLLQNKNILGAQSQLTTAKNTLAERQIALQAAKDNAEYEKESVWNEGTQSFETKTTNRLTKDSQDKINALDKSVKEAEDSVTNSEAQIRTLQQTSKQAKMQGWGMAASAAGMALSAWANTIDINENRGLKGGLTMGSSALQGLGTGLMVGASAGGPIGALVGVLTALPGVLQGAGMLTESTAERVQKLEKNITEASNERIKSKDELKTLEDYKKKYDELSKAQYESVEKKKEFLELSNTIASEYPELIKSMDAEGNYIVNMTEGYEKLAKAKREAYKEDIVTEMGATISGLEDIDYVIKNVYGQELIQNKRDWTGLVGQEWEELLKLDYTSDQSAAVKSKLSSGLIIGNAPITAGTLFSQEGIQSLKAIHPEMVGSRTQTHEGELYYEITSSGGDFLTQLYMDFLDQMQGDIESGREGVDLSTAQSNLIDKYGETYETLINGFDTDFYKQLQLYTQVPDYQKELINNRMSGYTAEYINLIADSADAVFDTESTDLMKRFAKTQLQDEWNLKYDELKAKQDKGQKIDWSTEISNFYKSHEEFWYNLQLESDELKGIDSQAEEFYKALGQHTKKDIENLFPEVDTTGLTGEALEVAKKNNEIAKKRREFFEKIYEEDYDDIINNYNNWLAQDDIAKFKVKDYSDKVGADYITQIQSQYKNIISNTGLSEKQIADQVAALNAITDFVTDQNLDFDTRNILLTKYSAADFTSLNGIYNFVDTLSNLDIDLDLTSLIAKVQSLGDVLAVNFEAEIDSYYDAIESSISDFNKAVKSVTEGTDLKTAREIADKMGKSLSDFQVIDGKFYFDDIEALKDAYIKENEEYVADVQKNVNERYSTLKDLSEVKFTSNGEEKTIQIDGQKILQGAESLEDLNNLFKSSESQLGFLEATGITYKEFAKYYEEFLDSDSSDFLTFMYDRVQNTLDESGQAILDYLQQNTARAQIKAGDIKGFLKTAGLVQSDAEIARTSAQHLAEIRAQVNEIDIKEQASAAAHAKQQTNQALNNKIKNQQIQAFSDKKEQMLNDFLYSDKYQPEDLEYYKTKEELRLEEDKFALTAEEWDEKVVAWTHGRYSSIADIPTPDLDRIESDMHKSKYYVYDERMITNNAQEALEKAIQANQEKIAEIVNQEFVYDSSAEQSVDYDTLYQEEYKRIRSELTSQLIQQAFSEEFSGLDEDFWAKLAETTEDNYDEQQKWALERVREYETADFVGQIMHGDYSALQGINEQYIGDLYEYASSAAKDVMSNIGTALKGGENKIKVTSGNLAFLQELQGRLGFIKSGTLTIGNLAEFDVEQMKNTSDETFIKYINSLEADELTKREWIQSFLDVKYPNKVEQVTSLAGKEKTISRSDFQTYLDAFNKKNKDFESYAKDYGLAFNQYTNSWDIDDYDKYIQALKDDAQLLGEGTEARREADIAIDAADRQRKNKEAQDQVKAFEDVVKNYDHVTDDQMTTLQTALKDDWYLVEQMLTPTGAGEYQLDIAKLRNNLDQLNLSDKVKESILQMFTSTADDYLKNISSATDLLTKGTTSQTDIQDFKNKAKALGMEISDSAFHYDDILQAWTLDPAVLRSFIQAQGQQLIDAGLLSLDEVTQYVNDNVTKTLLGAIDIKGFLEAEDKSGQARKKLAKQLSNAGIDGRGINGIIDTLIKGGSAAVSLMQSIAVLKGEELTSADIEQAYRAQVSEIEGALEQITFGPGGLISGYAVTILDTLAKEGKAEIVHLDANNAVIKSITDIGAAYAAYYDALAKSGEATLEALNEAKAKVLETQGDRYKEQSAIDALGDAVGMTYTAFAAILSDAGIEMTDDIIRDYTESLGGNKMRIKDFASFARVMKWDYDSEEYTSAFKSYNDALIERNTQVKDNINEELQGLKDFKAGDWLNLTYTEKQLKQYSKSGQSKINKALKELQKTEIDNLVTKRAESYDPDIFFKELQNALAEAGAYFDDGILKTVEGANIPGIFEILLQKLSEAADNLEIDTAEIQDALSELLSGFIDAIINGIKGSLGHKDAKNLIEQAQGFGVQLTDTDFTETADGLKLSTKAATNLYYQVSKVNAIKGRLIFDELNDSLKESDSRFKDITSIMTQIQQLTEEINSLKPQGGDEAKERVKAAERELALAKEIAAVRLTTRDDESFNIKGKNTLATSTHNAMNYLGDVADIADKAETWKTQGYVGKDDIEDFSDYVTHLIERGDKTGEGSQFYGVQFGGKGGITKSKFQAAISKAFKSVTDQNGKSQLAFDNAVFLKELGMDLGLGFEGFRQSENTIQGFMTEAGDFYKAYGGIFADMDYLSKSKQFGEFTGIEDLIDANGRWNLEGKSDAFKESLLASAEHIKIGGKTLADAIKNNELANDNSKKAVQDLITLAETTDWELESGYETIKEHMQRYGIEEEIDFGDFTYQMKGDNLLVKDNKTNEYVTSDGKTFKDAKEALTHMSEQELAEYSKEFTAYSQSTDTATSEIEIPGTEYHIRAEEDHFILVDEHGNQVGTSTYDTADQALKGSRKEEISQLWQERDRLKRNPPKSGTPKEIQDYNADIQAKESKILDEITSLQAMSDEGYSEWIKSGLRETGSWTTGAKNGKNSYGQITSDVRTKLSEGGWTAESLAKEANRLWNKAGLSSSQAAAEFKIKTGIDIDPNTVKNEFKAEDFSSYIEQLDLTQAAADVMSGITAAFTAPESAQQISATIGEGLRQAVVDLGGEDTNKVKIPIEIDAEQATTAIESIKPTEPVKIPFDGEIGDNIPPEVDPGEGTVNYTTGSVEKLPLQIGSGKVNYSVGNVEIPTDVVATGTINYKLGNVATPEGGDTSEATGNVGLASGNARAGGTLMGELGPELVVSKGRYFVVGQSGPEMVNLADDAIVFNHLQTQSLLTKGTSSTRGRAITNEQKAVAFATGSRWGGEAYADTSTMGSMYRSVVGDIFDKGTAETFNNISDNIAKNTETATEEAKNFIDQLERWYNWLQKIAQLEKEITIEEAKRTRYTSDMIPHGKEYFTSQIDSLKILKEELAVQKDLNNQRSEYFKTLRAKLNQGAFSILYEFDENFQPKYKEGMYEFMRNLLEADWYKTGAPNNEAKTIYNKLNSMGFGSMMEYDSSGNKINKDKEGWENQAVQAFVERYKKGLEDGQKYHDELMEGEQKLEELQGQENDILQDIEDNQISVEQKVLNAIEESRQRAIDSAKSERDAIEESANNLIDGLNEQLDKERTLYQNQQDADELASLQRRLGILQRSGGSASEIADLQSQIQDKQYDKYFDTQEQQIKAIQDASDAELERLDNQIELMEETLAYEKEFGLLWNDVDEVLHGSSQDIVDFISGNTEEYWGKSSAELAKCLREDTFEAERFKEFQAKVDGGMDALINMYGGGEATESEEQESETIQDTNSSSGGSKYTENAEGQWIQGNNGRWWYKHNDAEGSYTTNNWEKINDKWYHFDSEGWMQTGWFQDDDGKWYYLDDTKGANEGSMLTGTHKLTWNGKTENHTFDASGAWISSSPLTNNTNYQNQGPFDIIATDPLTGEEFVVGGYGDYADAKKEFNRIIKDGEGTTKSTEQVQPKNPNDDISYSYTNLRIEKAKLEGSLASGGYVNHGIYELGELGTETVLTASQTKVLRDNILSNRPDSLISLLKSYNEAYHGLSQQAYDSISSVTQNMVNIERAEVNLQIEKLADDYDSKRAANTIMDEMLRIASKTKANNSVRR